MKNKSNLRYIKGGKQNKPPGYNKYELAYFGFAYIYIMVIIFIFLFTVSSQARTIKIAVVDTGFDMNSLWKSKENQSTLLGRPKLCKTGHYNFVDNNNDVTDNHGHGTHVAGLIGKGNQDIDYCLIILKYYDPKSTDNLNTSIAAYRRAVELGVDIINMSGGGGDYSKEECNILNSAAKRGIKVVAAAGNEKQDINIIKYYPAMCGDDIIKVVNVDVNGKPAPSSNYDGTGKLFNVYYVPGVNVYSLAPKNSYQSMTGTSQSAAIYTSRSIRYLHNQKKHNREVANAKKRRH